MSEGFQTEKNFKSTKEVYGVDPNTLADMSYKDATILKYIHAKKRYINILEGQHSLPVDKSHYEEWVALEHEATKYRKAVSLAELQLSEIGVKYSEIQIEE